MARDRKRQDEKKPPQKEQLEGLAAFLPHFENPDFSFGEWGGGQESEPHHFQMPFFAYSEVASSFVQATYDLKWLDRTFDWGAWMQTEEAKSLRDNSEVLSAATPEQLSKLLTVLVRQNRFCEGALEGAFKAGLITAICRRAAVLLAELGSGGE